MPTYRVTDSETGREFELEGDSPPMEQELIDIFGGGRAAPTEPAPVDDSFVRQDAEPAVPMTTLDSAMTPWGTRQDLMEQPAPTAPLTFVEAMKTGGMMAPAKAAGAGLLGLPKSLIALNLPADPKEQAYPLVKAFRTVGEWQDAIRPERTGNYWYDTLMQGAESTTQSVGTAAAAFGAAKAGGLKGPALGPAIGGKGMLYVADQYQSLMDNVRQELEKEGMGKADIDEQLTKIQKYAAISGVAEGGFEVLGDVGLAKIFNLFGGVAKEPAKRGILNFLKKMGKSVAVEEGTELPTTGVQWWAGKEAGEKHGPLSEELKETAGSTLWMSMFMGLGGSAHNAITDRRNVSKIATDTGLSTSDAKDVYAGLKADAEAGVPAEEAQAKAEAKVAEKKGPKWSETEEVTEQIPATVRDSVKQLEEAAKATEEAEAAAEEQVQEVVPEPVAEAEPVQPTTEVEEVIPSGKEEGVVQEETSTEGEGVQVDEPAIEQPRPKARYRSAYDGSVIGEKDKALEDTVLSARNGSPMQSIVLSHQFQGKEIDALNDAINTVLAESGQSINAGSIAKVRTLYEANLAKEETQPSVQILNEETETPKVKNPTVIRRRAEAKQAEQVFKTEDEADDWIMNQVDVEDKNVSYDIKTVKGGFKVVRASDTVLKPVDTSVKPAKKEVAPDNGVAGNRQFMSAPQTQKQLELYQGRPVTNINTGFAKLRAELNSWWHTGAGDIDAIENNIDGITAVYKKAGLSPKEEMTLGDDIAELGQLFLAMKKMKDQRGFVDVTDLVNMGRTVGHWGQRVYESGARSFEQWLGRMKELFGHVWDDVKYYMNQVWKTLVRLNKELGERGSLGGMLTQHPEAVEGSLRLLDALEMKRKGAGSIEIWQKTGWIEAPNGEGWRFEIDDTNAVLVNENVTNERLDQVLEHPELYKHYPALKEINVRLRTGSNFVGKQSGYFNPRTNTLYGQAGNTALQMDNVLHEVQHAIQYLEGFPEGSSPTDPALATPERTTAANRAWSDYCDANAAASKAKKAWMKEVRSNGPLVDELLKKFEKLEAREQDLKKNWEEVGPYGTYKKVQGEYEARDTSWRWRQLSAEERKLIPPYSSEDLPWDQLLVIHNGKGTNFSVNQPFNSKQVERAVTLDFMGLSHVWDASTWTMKKVAKGIAKIRWDKVTIGNDRLSAFKEQWEARKLKSLPKPDDVEIKDQYGQIVKVKQSPKDAKLLRTIFMHTANGVKDIPAAVYTAHQIRNAELERKQNTKVGNLFLDDVENKLSDKEKEQLTKMGRVMANYDKGIREYWQKAKPDIEVWELELIADTAIDDAVQKFPGVSDAVKQAYVRMQAEFVTSMKHRILNQWRKEFLAGLEHRDAIRAMQGGMSQADVFQNFGLTTSAKQKALARDMKAYWDEITELEKWPVGHYWPRLMRGHIVVRAVVQGRFGKTHTELVTVAESQKEAVRQAGEFRKNNPAVVDMKVDTTGWLDIDMPMTMGRKAKWSLTRSIATLIEDTVNGISKSAAMDIATKTLRKKVQGPVHKPWTPALMETRDILPGMDNIFDSFRIYNSSVNRWLAYSDVVNYMKGIMDDMPPKAKASLQHALKWSQGAYSFSDEVAAAVIKQWGEWTHTEVSPKMAGTTALYHMRSVAVKAKMGYRPVNVFYNMAAAYAYPWMEYGSGNMWRGRQLLRSPEGKALISRNEAYLATNSIEVEEGKLQTVTRTRRMGTWKGAWNLLTPMGLWSASELNPRELNFCVAYDWIRRMEPQMKRDAWEDWARLSLEELQGLSTVAEAPMILRTPGSRTVGLFQRFVIRHLEMIARNGLSVPFWSRYLVFMLGTVGPRGIIWLLKSLPLLGLLASTVADEDDWLDKLEQETMARWPRASNGLPGLVGGVAAPASGTWQLPGQAEDFLGAVVKDGIRITKGFTSGDYTGDNAFFKMSKDIAAIAPMFRGAMEAIESFRTNNGVVLDRNGDAVFHLNDALSRTVNMTGFRPLDREFDNLQNQIINSTRRRKNAALDQMADAIVQKINYGRMPEAAEILGKFTEVAERYGAGAADLSRIKGRIEAIPLDRSDRITVRAATMRMIDTIQAQQMFKENNK